VADPKEIDMAERNYRLADLPAKIAARITIDPVSGCWLWSGVQNGSGYGQVHWDGRMRYVHRVVYELLAGPIPAGTPELDHVRAWGCRHKRCCWPAHLEPVTHQENARRALARERCPAGHEYPAEGKRSCLTCRREREGWSELGPFGLRTHCKRGHEFTPANTYIGKSGSRFCRTCARITGRERYRLRRPEPSASQ
jgi:hypothetical protein